MDVSKDKLSEYIMYAGEFNRYEEFATSDENYAWVDEANKDDTHPGECKLYYEGSSHQQGNERIGLIKSDHVFGKHRQAARVVFDIVHADSLWEMGGDAYAQGSETEEFFDWGVVVTVRPVLVDFDPSDISWNDAYDPNNGLLVDNLGAAVECLLVDCSGKLTVTPLSPPGAEASGQIDISSELPGLFVIKLQDMDFDGGTHWNEEDAISGFEFRIGIMGKESSKVKWEGDPSDSRTVCFAIRA